VQARNSYGRSFVLGSRACGGFMQFYCQYALYAAIFGAVAPHVAVLAAEPGAAGRAIAEFDVRKGGDLLTLPVAVGDATYPFSIETGSEICVFDAEMWGRLDSSRSEVVVIDSFVGPLKAKTIKSPPLRLGPFNLNTVEIGASHSP